MSVDELAATPLAWVDMRLQNVQKVTTVLGEVNAANLVAIDAAEQHRTAQDETEQCSTALAEYTASREEVERQLEAAVAGWQKSATHFPTVPDVLVEPDSVDGRVNPVMLTSWLDQQAAVIRQRLDVPGHLARKDAANDTAVQAVVFATRQQDIADEAADAVEEAQTRHDLQVSKDLLATEQDATTDRDAQGDHIRTVDAARRHRHEHLVAQLEQTRAALDAVIIWAEQVRQWQTTLTHLGSTDFTMPRLTEHVERLLGELSTTSEVASAEAQTGSWLSLDSPAVTLAERSLTTLADYDDGQVFAAARDEFARRLEVAHVVDLRPAGSLTDEAYDLALTLHMAALVAVDAQSRGTVAPKRPADLSAYLIARERDHWATMYANGRITQPGRVMGRLVGLATFTRPLPNVAAARKPHLHPYRSNTVIRRWS